MVKLSAKNVNNLAKNAQIQQSVRLAMTNNT